MSSIPKKIDAKPARSVLSNWGAFLFAALVSFFMGPYVLNKLGATTYGVWMLIGTLVSYLALLDLGVRSAVTKFIATRHGAGDHAGARAVKSAALLAFVLAAAIAVVATLAITPFADQIFTIPSELKTTAKYVIVICGLNVALSLVSGVYGGILVARHRFDLLNLVNVALVVARSVAMVVVLELHQGIFALALIQLGSSVIQLFMTEILCRKVYPEAMKGPAQPFSMGNVQMLFSFGLLTSMVHILGAVAHYSAPLIIGSMLPVAMVTYFSIAALLTEYARQLVSGISQTLTPVVGAMEGARQLEAVGRLLISGTRYANFVILPIVVTFIVRGHTFIGLWMGAEYADLAGQILVILSVALWAITGHQISTSIMIGLGRHKGLVPIFAFEAVANVLLTVFLIQRIGVLGAAWGAMAPRLLVCLVLCVIYAHRTIQLPYRSYYVDAIVRPAIAIIPFVLLSLAIETWWPARNLAEFFVQVFLALPAALLGTWVVGLNTEERTKCIASAKVRLGVG